MLSSVLGSVGVWAQKIPSWALGTAVWQAAHPVFLFLTMGVTLKSTYPTQTALIIGWSWVDWLLVVVTRCWAGSLGGGIQWAGFCSRRLLQFCLCPAGGSTDRYKMESLQEVLGRGEPG